MTLLVAINYVNVWAKLSYFIVVWQFKNEYCMVAFYALYIFSFATMNRKLKNLAIRWIGLIHAPYKLSGLIVQFEFLLQPDKGWAFSLAIISNNGSRAVQNFRLRISQAKTTHKSYLPNIVSAYLENVSLSINCTDFGFRPQSV